MTEFKKSSKLTRFNVSTYGPSHCTFKCGFSFPFCVLPYFHLCFSCSTTFVLWIAGGPRIVDILSKAAPCRGLIEKTAQAT